MLKSKEDCKSWSTEVLESVRKYCKDNNLKFGHVAMMTRIALTGGKVSPPLDKIMEFLGREETAKRLTMCVEWCEKHLVR